MADTSSESGLGSESGGDRMRDGEVAGGMEDVA
jgi:hypothetical protein